MLFLMGDFFGFAMLLRVLVAAVFAGDFFFVVGASMLSDEENGGNSSSMLYFAKFLPDRRSFGLYYFFVGFFGFRGETVVVVVVAVVALDLRGMIDFCWFLGFFGSTSILGGESRGFSNVIFEVNRFAGAEG